ncbi:MAG TPA: hypothetical protein VJZ00_11670 [Thermoanaerobaculia bacterium]|nr:hypothetical protein [Thermoanaerobaculia bacterium]
MHDIEHRLAACERKNRWLTTFILLQTIAIVALRCATTPAPTAPTSLRARELVIVDDNGVERVRVTGNAPDAVIKGKRVPRGDEAAGVLLYDDSGQERGGYITFTKSKNVALTLDGLNAQTALFIATPDGATALRLWRGQDEVSLRTDEDGPRITGIRNGAVEFQQPPIASPEKTSTCAELRESRSRLTESQVLGYCKRAMPESQCRVCLGIE